MFRRAITAAAAASVVIGALGPAAAAPPEIEDSMVGWGILNPGQSGIAFDPHNSDQVEPYAALADDSDITDDELGTYFHPLQFGDESVDEYMPPGNDNVTIYRSPMGVPQVFGDTDEDMAYGIGYAMAEDRMWEMDVFRHVARGQAAGFIGDNYLNSDKAIRRDGYTDAELQKMFDAFDDRFGDVGAKTRSMLQAYADGINAFVAEGNAPGEYLVTGNTMSEWSVLDSMALTVFQGRSFGGDGGNEVASAAHLRDLQDLNGSATGKQIWADLLFRNDADAYTTIPAEEGEFNSPLWGSVSKKAVAIPDNAKYVARVVERRSDAAFKAASKVGFSRLASNGIVVAGSNTTSGNPIHYGAPQVGYATPSFLYEIEGHSPNFDFAGPTVPGGGPIIVLGRTAHLAWMIPVGVGDMMDERAELLCNPNGGAVKKNSNYYEFKGKCRKMKIRTELITNEDGGTIKYKVRRTVHGPVVATATVKGDPVAISQERTTWMREPDLLVAFGMWTNKTTDTEAEFAEGVEVFPMSFNILYADSDQTAYYYGGIQMLRADGVDARLPSWGTGKWEWIGQMSEEGRPRMVDPAQGWFANWNNKPSVGWDGSASSTWGPAHRVRLLINGMEAHDGTFTMSDVVEVAATAATQDAYAVQLWPLLSGSITPSSPAEVAAFAAVEDWVASGAHRTDEDRDEVQDSSTAVATWDTMINNLLGRVFGDELGTLDGWGFNALDDAPNSNGSSYFFSFPDYLLNLVNGHADKYSRDYCDIIDSETAETCAAQTQGAFSEAVSILETNLGPVPATWEWEADYIEFAEFGAATAPDFPWQNRGTWNHILELMD